MLDQAGFACLEVSGGGCFDCAVRRGVESPWERIRAHRRRCSTPLGMALRGRFLVGLAAARSAISCAASSRARRRAASTSSASTTRSTTSSNLREAAEAVREAGKELVVGLVHNPGPTGEADELVERAPQLAELGASRVVVHDPAGSLDAAQARELVERVREASGLPVGLYCQGAGGAALAAAIEAARAGAERDRVRDLPGRAHAPPRLGGGADAVARRHRASTPGVDLDVLWRGSELVDEALGDMPVPPLSPRVAVRAAEHRLPAGLVAELDDRLREHGSADRLDEVLEELTRVRRECGWPPLASPIGQMLGSQALLHVLSAQRWQLVVDEVRDLVEGRYGSPPRRVDPTVARAVELLGDGCRRRRRPPQGSRSSARTPRAWPRARRSCSCSRSSARTPSRCSQPIRGAGRRRRVSTGAG